MTVSIRTARPSDAGEIAQLTTQLGYDLKEADAADRLSRVLLRDDQQFFVADVDGRAVGWVHVVFAEYVDAEAFVLIGGLVVDRNHRRFGIGRALMDRAEVWARERGCSMVRLTSSATREAAHRFYENLGYMNIKTQRDTSLTRSSSVSRAGTSDLAPIPTSVFAPRYWRWLASAWRREKQYGRWRRPGPPTEGRRALICTAAWRRQNPLNSESARTAMNGDPRTDLIQPIIQTESLSR